MSIVTINPHTWVRIVNQKNGKTMSIENSEYDGQNYVIPFEVNFANVATPQSSTITFYNLSKAHRNFLKKGMKVYLYFNWGSHKKLLVEGFITKIDMQTSDGTTDTQVITIKEGTDYSNVKARRLKEKKHKTVTHTKSVKQKVPGHYKNIKIHYKETKIYKIGKRKGQTYTVNRVKDGKKWVKATTKNKRVKTKASKTVRVNRVFRAGTTYKSVIQGVARASGIKLSKIELAKNPKLKKSYTASGKPLNVLKKLVKDTSSAITYVRGKMEITNPKSKKRTWYQIDDQDLIQPPSYNESDDDKSSDGTWEINIPLVPDITTNVGIEMKSKYLKGKFYVTAGQHTNDGENPQTQCSLKKI